MSVIRPTVPKHQTDKSDIRGKHIEDLIGDNVVRVNYLKQVQIRAILHRLGLLEYSLADTSMSYQSVCVAKITSALEYRLKRLHEEGHVMATFTKPYKAQWKPHTRAWGEDNWDGNTLITLPLELDSTSSSGNCMDNDRQTLTQWMAQLSINPGGDENNIAAGAQDQQGLHQEQQRQRHREEHSNPENLKREYQKQQDTLAQQRDDQIEEQQQQQGSSLETNKGLSVSQWAMGVNSSELTPMDSISSREWKSKSSRFYLEEPSPSLASRKSTSYAVPQTIPSQIQSISTTMSPIEPVRAKEEGVIMQYSHQKWVEEVTTLAWTIRSYRADCKFDTSSLRDQLMIKLKEGSPWSTFGIMIGKLCL
ncbi:hypothetical protein FPHYL_4569 [Fusarium phyllophilum]|uniref:Uncharacterized protein n=1 Tax=Fusarium phyllophilum TaxID=47803 RepID=A0A8H5NFV6_9HYPO|nr:hypothetical protein FPHYL_4569 [Fusarium phyllophilum]